MSDYSNSLWNQAIEAKRLVEEKDSLAFMLTVNKLLLWHKTRKPLIKELIGDDRVLIFSGLYFDKHGFYECLDEGRCHVSYKDVVAIYTQMFKFDHSSGVLPYVQTILDDYARDQIKNYS